MRVPLFGELQRPGMWAVCLAERGVSRSPPLDGHIRPARQTAYIPGRSLSSKQNNGRTESQVNWAAFGGVIGVAWVGEGIANRHGGHIAQGRQQQQPPGPFPAATSDDPVYRRTSAHPTMNLCSARFW